MWISICFYCSGILQGEEFAKSLLASGQAGKKKSSKAARSSVGLSVVCFLRSSNLEVRVWSGKQPLSMSNPLVRSQSVYRYMYIIVDSGNLPVCIHLSILLQITFTKKAKLWFLLRWKHLRLTSGEKLQHGSMRIVDLTGCIVRSYQPWNAGLCQNI